MKHNNAPIPPTVDALITGLGLFMDGNLKVHAARLQTFLAGYYSEPVSKEATKILKRADAAKAPSRMETK